MRHYSSRRALCNAGTRLTTKGWGLSLAPLTCDDECSVPLAGLEPATCCLGDGSAQTLCSTAKLLVTSDRGAKVIVSSDLRDLSRYPARTASAPIGHVYRTVDGRTQRAAHRTLAYPSPAGWPPRHRNRWCCDRAQSVATLSSLRASSPAVDRPRASVTSLLKLSTRSEIWCSDHLLDRLDRLLVVLVIVGSPASAGGSVADEVHRNG